MAASLSIHVSSNWDAFERELQKLLLLKTKDGTELANQGDITLMGHIEPVLLEAPNSTEGLVEGTDSPVIHLESFSPTDSLTLDSVEVISEARNVEVYGEGEEYIGTATGVVSAEGNEDLKVYSCRYRFHEVFPLIRLTLKFVSLGGRHKFYIQKILLTFRRLPSGLSSTQQPSAFPGQTQWSATDALSAVNSLHGAGVPQEVAGLINALQHLGAMDRSRLGRDTERGKVGELPPEVQSAISMLRQVRSSATAKEESMCTTEAIQPEETEESEHTSQTQTCSRCGQPGCCATKDDMQQMEARVRAHMDQALDRLQKHFDCQIDKLTHALDSLVHRS